MAGSVKALSGNAAEAAQKVNTSTPIIASDMIENNLVNEFGYEASYRRVFRSIGSMSLSIAMASPMAGIFVTSVYQYTYGGYWGLTWGWFIPAVAFFPWALATAEFCSSMPVNGASYWWTAALAPPHVSRPISFIAGMGNVMYALTNIASFAWATSSSVCTVIGLASGWVPSSGAVFGVAIAICLIWLLTASIRMDEVSKLFIGVAGVVLITTACFFVGLPVAQASKGLGFAPAARVFDEYTNSSDWGEAVAVPMTFFGAVWVITGWNAPAAVAEETHNARIVAPRSILSTYAIQASMGLIVCILLAFCTIDLESAAGDPTGYPVFTIIFDRWGPKVGVAFFLLCFLNTAIGGAAVLVMLSCQVAAFARNGGLIYNDKLSYVSPRSNMPPYTTVFLSIGGILILCLAFSPIASQIIYSLAVIATMIMYGLPMVFRIFHGGRWVPGPFNYGVFSMPIHIWGLVSVVYMAIMECFPPTRNWTWATLNWSWAVLLGAILISTVLWFAHGSRTYKGVDQELLAAYRERLLQSREGAAETNVSSSSYIIGVKPSAQKINPT